MGTAPDMKAEQVRAMLLIGAQATQAPEVAEALAALVTALLDLEDEPSVVVAALTFAAAAHGSSDAVPGLEREAEEVQIAMLRSVYATRQLTERTLH